MNNELPYLPYSEYLRRKYHEKVYKLPVNLPLTCPNRIHGTGCDFCAEAGTGFEAQDNQISVADQLLLVREKIEKKYHAHKFIAYFQNFTNTFLPLEQFRSYVTETAGVKDIVEIAVSTRPDCIDRSYLDVLAEIKQTCGTEITIELGLQSTNCHTLQSIHRGHSLAEFIDAVLMIRDYPFEICTHVILNLPGDDLTDAIEMAKVLSALRIQVVKAHSLYIAPNTKLYDLYTSGTITLCSKEEYIERAAYFLAYLNPEIAVERMFSRIPETDSVFCNWGNSWWKLRDELFAYMKSHELTQGCSYHYLGGSALRLL